MRLDVWFGRSLFFFTYYIAGGGERQAAFLRWFQQTDPDCAASRSLRLVRLGWAHFGAGHGPHHDVVELERILCPVLLQPDPCEPNSWWLNHYVAPYSM